MMNASVNTIRSSKTAPDWSKIKDGGLLKKLPHPWHRSIDRKHTFLRVKSEVKFIISSTRKFMKSGFFLVVWSILFSKGGV
jgi:hypothetical protein